MLGAPDDDCITILVKRNLDAKTDYVERAIGLLDILYEVDSKKEWFL
jgi:hypothetical protein